MKKHLKWFAKYGGLVIFAIFLYLCVCWWLPLYELQIGLKAVFVSHAIIGIILWIAYGAGALDGD
jgi:hypothetical protein